MFDVTSTRDGAVPATKHASVLAHPLDNDNLEKIIPASSVIDSRMHPVVAPEY